MKRKKSELQLLVHVSVFKALKGKEKKPKRSFSKQITKNQKHYTTFINRGNVQITSHKFYLPAATVPPVGKQKKPRIDADSNTQKINRVAATIFQKFKGSEQDDITVTAQLFKGEIKNPYRAKIDGDISRGASYRALKKPVVKRTVDKLNSLRKRKGIGKQINFEKYLESVHNNLLVDLEDEFDTLSVSSYTPKPELEAVPKRYKVEVDGFYYSRRLRSKETGRYYRKRIHVHEYSYWLEA